MISMHTVTDVPLWGVAIASMLFRFLPPPEKYDGYPRLQKYYKPVYATVEWVALNK